MDDDNPGQQMYDKCTRATPTDEQGTNGVCACEKMRVCGCSYLKRKREREAGEERGGGGDGAEGGVVRVVGLRGRGVRRGLSLGGTGALERAGRVERDALLRADKRGELLRELELVLGRAGHLETRGRVVDVALVLARALRRGVHVRRVLAVLGLRGAADGETRRRVLGDDGGDGDEGREDGDSEAHFERGWGEWVEVEEGEVRRE